MEIRRFFANQSDCNGKEIFIKGDEFIHMTKVLRHKIGFKIIVCLDNDYEYYCTIKEINKDCAVCTIDCIQQSINEPKCNINLYIAISKPEKIELIVQKAVELGVKSITPIITKYSEKSTRLDRLNKISLEASKQCGRSKFILVNEPIEFEKAINNLSGVTLCGYELENKLSFSDIETSVFSEKSINIFIGAEGGFDVTEIQKLKDIGTLVFSLGTRILRTETAAISILTLVMYRCGGLSL